MKIRTYLVMSTLSVLAVSARAETLYDEDQYRSLVSDRRAYQVGDMLTVLIVEAAAAESRADTSENADFSLDAGVNDASEAHRIGFAVESGSGGAGRTTRTGQLRAQISARIEDTLPSGDYQIRGSQLITINGEQQKILVQGVVRPADIASDNSVISSRLADARIEFTGQGWVSRNQKPGLFRRLFQFIGF